MAHIVDRLFLGIDHTAIVVFDTETSLRFYRDALGLPVAGEYHYGPEQERLNNVFGARLQITGLRAAAGPGIEFLEYLSPRNGRPAVGIESNDIAHWETTMTSRNAIAAFTELQRGRVLFVCTSVVTFDDDRRFTKGLLVRDPDGHAVKGDRAMTAEERRLTESNEQRVHWKRWGPYPQRARLGHGARGL